MSRAQKWAPPEPLFKTGMCRAKKRIEYEGPSSLGDDELLALVLGRGVEGLSATSYARSLLEELGGLTRLSRLRPGGLHGRPGLGAAQAARLCAAFELGRRAERDDLGDTPLSLEEIERWARPRLTTLDHEEVWVLCVNAQTILKSTWLVGRGGLHGCALQTRDILTPVVRDAAAAFILVHNHPSGDPAPSPEDIEITRALRRAAQAICVPLLDHIVVARQGVRSLFELASMEE